MTVEVMSILPGVYLVDIAKTTGDTVDFYNAYAKITELVQPLITADALRRADSGAQAFLKSSMIAQQHGQQGVKSAAAPSLQTPYFGPIPTSAVPTKWAAELNTF